MHNEVSFLSVYDRVRMSDEVTSLCPMYGVVCGIHHVVYMRYDAVIVLLRVHSGSRFTLGTRIYHLGLCIVRHAWRHQRCFVWVAHGLRASALSGSSVKRNTLLYVSSVSYVYV